MCVILYSAKFLLFAWSRLFDGTLIGAIFVFLFSMPDAVLT